MSKNIGIIKKVTGIKLNELRDKRKAIFDKFKDKIREEKINNLKNDISHK